MSIDIFVETTGRTTTTRKPARFNWTTVILLCILAFLVTDKIGGCSDRDISPDDRSVVIDESGKFALIVQDKTEAGQSRLSTGQAAAINSVAVKEWCDDNGFLLRVVDVSDDLSTMEDVWQQLSDQAASPPSLTIASEGEAKTGELPDGVQPTIQALESMQ